MIPRSLPADASTGRTKLTIGFLATLVSLAVGACAAGTDPPAAQSNEQPPPDPPTTIPSEPAPEVDATQADAASNEEAGRQDGGGAYTYGDWSEWSNCSVTCGDGTKTRTRECKRRDGLPVNCALCGGACTDTEACSASTCCGTREECCPVMPYNVCGGTMMWCTDTIAQYAATCLAAGCLWTGAKACTIGGSVSNATLPGGMGTCQ